MIHEISLINVKYTLHINNVKHTLQQLIFNKIIINCGLSVDFPSLDGIIQDRIGKTTTNDSLIGIGGHLLA